MGRLTAAALGLQFIQQAPPPPKHDPPGTPQQGATVDPQTFLIKVFAKELKQISNRVNQILLNGFETMPEAYDRPRKHLRAITHQTLLFLSSVASSRSGAGFVANQASSALLMIVGGFGAVAGQVARGGGDSSEINAIQTELNARTGRIVDIIRKTLEGTIDGGLRAGVRLLRGLLFDLGNG